MLIPIATGALVTLLAFILMGPTSSIATFNSSDVMFTQMMLPHHLQAIDMAEMLLNRV